MLNKPVPPALAQDAFVVQAPAFLSGPAGRDGYRNPIFVGVAPPVPNAEIIGGGVAAAVPVYVLSADDAAKDTVALPHAEAAWQFFAGQMEEPNPQVILGTVIRTHDRTWKLIRVHYGPIVVAELTQLNELYGLPELAERPYDPAVLSIPAVNVKAFWLRPHNVEETDYLTPIPSAPGEMRVYDRSQFLSGIGPLAKRNRTIRPGFGA
jgi:hypothetical protein